MVDHQEAIIPSLHMRLSGYQTLCGTSREDLCRTLVTGFFFLMLQGSGSLIQGDTSIYGTLSCLPLPPLCTTLFCHCLCSTPSPLIADLLHYLSLPQPCLGAGATHMSSFLILQASLKTGRQIACAQLSFPNSCIC